MKLKSKEVVSQALGIIRDHVDDHLQDKCSINPGLIGNQIKNIFADTVLFTVRIVHMENVTKPFIMCVYPDVTELERKSSSLVTALNNSKEDAREFVSIWSDIVKWNIEIDSRLLDKGDRICVDNGSQFVAILCHEIGHVLDTHPSHLYYNYRMNRAKLSFYEKMLSNKPTMAKLFLPMFVCIGGLRIIVNKPISQSKEIKADYLIPAEYKPYMVEYVDRHIIHNPKVSSDVIKTNEEFDAEQSTGVTFTAECIRLMTQRRNILKAQLLAQYRLSPNGYYKEICKTVIKAVSGMNPDTGKDDIVKEKRIESKVKDDMEASVKESVLLEAANVDDRAIILLKVNADSITTTADKQFVINTVFDYLNILNKKREKILSKTKETDPKKLAALTKAEDDKIKMLNQILSDVMDKKVTEYEHYGLFVKYPEGYEG